jgi:hypothetical protein
MTYRRGPEGHQGTATIWIAASHKQHYQCEKLPSHTLKAATDVNERTSSQALWQCHYVAWKFLSGCGQQSSGLTECHRMGCAQISCTEPRHIAMQLAHLCTVKESPLRSYVLVRWCNMGKDVINTLIFLGDYSEK